MSRFSLNSLPKNQRIQLIGEFYDAIALLRSREEVRNFFRDLLSPSEIAMLMRRVEVAALLSAGYSHSAIQKLTGIGKGTVIAIHKKMIRENRGEGYEVVTKRILLKRKKRIQCSNKRVKTATQSFERLKKKYPFHYLFQHILDEIEVHREFKSTSFTARAIRKTPSRRKKE